jgi:cytochrome c-type biogenesis protein
MHEVGIPAAFLAGLVSFLSPCVLPLVPGYVSLISGVGIEELKAQETALLRKVMLNSIAFVLGFSIVFVTLGALSTEIGQLAAEYKSTLARVAGVLVIVFGLHLTGILRIKALYADKRLHNVKGGNTPWGAFVIGFAFAFGWTPCVGPILSGILLIAAAQNSVAKGILLLTVYSLGLAVPFLLTAVGIERFMKFYGGFRRHMHVVEVASGALLIVLGGLLIFGKFTLLSRYFSFLNRFVL